MNLEAIIEWGGRCTGGCNQAGLLMYFEGTEEGKLDANMEVVDLEVLNWQDHVTGAETLLLG